MCVWDADTACACDVTGTISCRRRRSPGSLDIPMFNSSPGLLIRAMLDVRVPRCVSTTSPPDFRGEQVWIFFFHTLEPRCQRWLYDERRTGIWGFSSCVSEQQQKKKWIKVLKSSRGIDSSRHCEADLDVSARIKSPLMNTDCCSLPAAPGSTKLPGIWHVRLSLLIAAVLIAGGLWCISAETGPGPILILQSVLLCALLYCTIG